MCVCACSAMKFLYVLSLYLWGTDNSPAATGVRKYTHIRCTYACTHALTHTRTVCWLMELFSSLMSVVVVLLSVVPLITSLHSPLLSLLCSFFFTCTSLFLLFSFFIPCNLSSFFFLTFSSFCRFYSCSLFLMTLLTLISSLSSLFLFSPQFPFLSCSSILQLNKWGNVTATFPLQLQWCFNLSKTLVVTQLWANLHETFSSIKKLCLMLLLSCQYHSLLQHKNPQWHRQCGKLQTAFTVRLFSLRHVSLKGFIDCTTRVNVN